MHEVGAVGALVDAVLLEIAGRQPCRVDAVRVRRGSTFSEDALAQAWAMLCRRTPLEAARLDVQVVNHVIDCACGVERTIMPDDLVGHLWVCPTCAHVEEIDEHDDLTLLGVTLTPLPSASGIGGA